MAGQVLRASSSGKAAVSKAADVGSIPTARANTSWAAVLSAFLGLISVLIGGLAVYLEAPLVLGVAGLFGLTSIAWAILSFRDD